MYFSLIYSEILELIHTSASISFPAAESPGETRSSIRLNEDESCWRYTNTKF